MLVQIQLFRPNQGVESSNLSTRTRVKFAKVRRDFNPKLANVGTIRQTRPAIQLKQTEKEDFPVIYQKPDFKFDF